MVLDIFWIFSDITGVVSDISWIFPIVGCLISMVVRMVLSLSVVAMFVVVVVVVVVVVARWRSPAMTILWLARRRC